MTGAANRAGATGDASGLLRSLDLLVDGPAAWGAVVPSRAAGVFVVELPSAPERAPLSDGALRAWLTRVPDLMLDGRRPTTSGLAARLAAFWLPREPVLYVGWSARSIGQRLTAMYATRLGDARPYAGGHWLKTLAPQRELRVWWAETDAAEEYADALLAAVAERASTGDALPSRLPFANLSDSSGVPKAHGIQHALREPALPPARAAPTAPGTPAAPRRAPRPGAGGRRSARPAGPSNERPAPAPSYLSRDGLATLQAELEELRTRVRPGVIERVKAARELGDLRENAEYESARKEQSFVEGRIQALEALVKAAVVVDAPAASGAAGVGSTVVVESGTETQTFVLVGSSEADPDAGRISYASPVGQALLGRRPGDEVVARLPGRDVRYTVREVR